MPVTTCVGPLLLPASDWGLGFMVYCKGYRLDFCPYLLLRISYPTKTADGQEQYDQRLALAAAACIRLALMGKVKGWFRISYPTWTAVGQEQYDQSRETPSLAVAGKPRRYRAESATRMLICPAVD